jgi:predicted Fe-Mo cluster-binding NifX family protein
MIIMISSQGKTLQSQFNPRFGRSPYFIKYDIQTEKWEAYPNPAVEQSGGAGVAASQFLIDHKTEIAISGRFGPNAFQTLNAGGIKILTQNNHTLTISEVIEAFSAGELKEVELPE